MPLLNCCYALEHFHLQSCAERVGRLEWPGIQEGPADENAPYRVPPPRDRFDRRRLHHLGNRRGARHEWRLGAFDQGVAQVGPAAGAEIAGQQADIARRAGRRAHPRPRESQAGFDARRSQAGFAAERFDLRPVVRPARTEDHSKKSPSTPPSKSGPTSPPPGRIGRSSRPRSTPPASFSSTKPSAPPP